MSPPAATAIIAGILLLLAEDAAPSLLFVADPATNDFYIAAARQSTLPCRSFTTVSSAVAAATPKDGLLVMADALLPSNPGFPQSGVTTINAEDWGVITEKELIVYIEFPRSMPGGGHQPVLQTKQSLFERVVVAAASNNKTLGPALQHLQVRVRCTLPLLPFFPLSSLYSLPFLFSLLLPLSFPFSC